jgi:protein SCO1/2
MTLRSPHRRFLLLAAGATALAGCQRAAPAGPFKGIDLTGATYGSDFRLPDPEGSIRSLAEFKGKVVLVFFGFVQCPDVCPTTLARAMEVRKLQVVLITVDPERDTPQVLGEYMKAYDPSFIALRGDAEQLAATAKEFKVFFQKVPTSKGSYTMDHTALTYAFDATGRLRLALRHEHSAADVAADLKLLLSS